MNNIVTYTEACHMDLDEILEANHAFDIYLEKKEQAQKKGGKK